MSTESPTLKIRVAPDDRMWGKDCAAAARELLGPDVKILDAKWGREPSKWHATDRGWGRPKLTGRELGFVEAVEAMENSTAIDSQLVAIIRRLTS